MEQPMTDHDAVVTLVANVATLKEGQDKFHIEVKDLFRDLKENYSSRIDAHDGRITKLENYRSWVVGALSLGGLLMALITYIYFSDIHGIRDELAKHETETQKSLDMVKN